MTFQEFLQQVKEFFASPLGTLLMVLLMGVVTYLASILKAKGDIAKQAEVVRVESAAETARNQAEAARVENEREQQNISDREAIRKLMVTSQTKIGQLQGSLDAANQRERAFEESQRKAAAKEREYEATQQRLEQIIQDAVEKLAIREEESLKSRGEIQTLTVRVTQTEVERNDALGLVEKRNQELEEQKRQNTEQKESINKLEKKLNETREEVEKLQKRIDDLEKKPTGPLDPNELPPAGTGEI